FERNLLARSVDPVNVERSVGRKKYQARSRGLTGSPMHVVWGQEHEIAMMSHEDLVIFHLQLQRAAHQHRSFARSVPMKWSDAARGKFRQDHGWSFARITPFHCHSKAPRSVGNGAELGG